MTPSHVSTELEACLEAEILPRRAPTHFSIRRLHNRSENSWAVIEQPDGAIAESETGELLLRLTKETAIVLAKDMTVQIRDRTQARLAA